MFCFDFCLNLLGSFSTRHLCAAETLSYEVAPYMVVVLLGYIGQVRQASTLVILQLPMMFILITLLLAHPAKTIVGTVSPSAAWQTSYI